MKITLLLLGALGQLAFSQNTYERLLKADKEPGQWMTYSGSYKGWRHSALKQITRENVDKLKVD